MGKKPPTENRPDENQHIDLDKRNYDLPSKRQILEMEGVIDNGVDKSTADLPVPPDVPAVSKTVVLPELDSPNPEGTKVLWSASPEVASVGTNGGEHIPDGSANLDQTSDYPLLKEEILITDEMMIQGVDASTANLPVTPGALAMSKTVILPEHDLPHPGGIKVLWGASSEVASVGTNGGEHILADDPDLAETNSYLPTRKDVSNTRAGLELDHNEDLDGSRPGESFSAKVAPSKSGPKVIVPDLTVRDECAQGNISPAAQDSLRPAVVEEPPRALSLREEDSVSRARAVARRTSPVRLLSAGVLAALCLGALGLLFLSSSGNPSSNKAPTGQTGSKQVTDTPVTQRVQVRDINTVRAEKPSALAEPTVGAVRDSSERGAKISRDESAITASASTYPRDQLQPDRSGTMPVNAQTKDERRPTDGPATDRSAVDALISGRTNEALALYHELAQKYPDQPAYGAIAKILKRRATQR